MKKNYYEILGVSRNATREEIYEATKKIVENEQPKKGSERWKEIEEAYNTLIDPVKREQYDKVLDFKVVIPETEESTQEIEPQTVIKKDYYQILGISKNATREEIYGATKKILENERPRPNSKRYNDIEEAYSTLIDPTVREEYDKMFEQQIESDYPSSVRNIKVQPKTKSFLKKNAMIKIVPFVTAVIICVAGCSMITNSSKKSSKNDESNITSSQSVDNNSSSIDMPEVEQKLLTAENIDEKVQEILTDNKSKGLNIDPTFIKSALFITNIDYLDQEDIKKMFSDGNLNIIEEIQNMYNYTSAVGTHNNNLALGNIKGSHISLAPLAYDEQDKLMLEELDEEFLKLTNNITTNEQFQTSFKYITQFYTGYDHLTTDNEQHSNYSLTSGGGLLSEQYWPMFSVMYASSQFVTSENQIDIKTLSENVINGSKYLGSIVNHESLQCLEETPVSEVSEEKTLTKTQ